VKVSAELGQARNSSPHHDVPVSTTTATSQSLHLMKKTFY